VELAAEIGRAQPSRLIMAAISAVFTIGYVATLLGEDENWIFDLSISMCPEDGCLWVHGVGENGVPAFTRDGIENLRQIIADERAAGRGPPTKPPKWPTLRRSPNAYRKGVGRVAAPINFLAAIIMQVAGVRCIFQAAPD
jgi:hypothetical protein